MEKRLCLVLEDMGQAEWLDGRNTEWTGVVCGGRGGVVWRGGESGERGKDEGKRGGRSERGLLELWILYVKTV